MEQSSASTIRRWYLAETLTIVQWKKKENSPNYQIYTWEFVNLNENTGQILRSLINPIFHVSFPESESELFNNTVRNLFVSKPTIVDL